jgi:hypothetical protein
MSILSSRLRTLVLALPLATALGACHAWGRAPAASPTRDHFLRGPVRVTRTDGSSLVLVGVTIGRDSLFGSERARQRVRVAIPVSEVRKVETRRVDPLATAVVLVIPVTAFIAMTGTLVPHAECSCAPPPP